MDYIEKIIQEINKEIVMDEIKKIMANHSHKFDKIIKKINYNKKHNSMVMIK